MITTPNRAIAPSLITALASHTDLTDAQKASLKAEIQGAAYTGKTTGEQVRLLNLRQRVPNPVTERPYVTRTQLPRQEWGILASRMLGRLRAASATATTAQQSAVLTSLIDVINEQTALVPMVGYVQMDGSAWQTFEPIAIQAGAVTQTEIDALTSVPDPSWSPTVTISRAAALFGDGAMIEASDVIAALAS